MAAESIKKNRRLGQIIQPYSVIDKTIMESVTGLITEVTNSTISMNASVESKDVVLWIKFENNEILKDVINVSDSFVENREPLILTVGYTTGVEVYCVYPTGEAEELLCWKENAVKIFKILPKPECFFSCRDLFHLKRPLIVISDCLSDDVKLYSISFLSLKSGSQIKCIRFKNKILDILCNKRVIVVTFLERIVVFDSCTLEDRFIVTNCYPCTEPINNPVALGTRWLAYADKKFIHKNKSRGGITNNQSSQSYTSTMMIAARSFRKGLKDFGETLASNFTSKCQLGVPSMYSSGVVTILDIKNVKRGEISIQEDANGIIAHFVAHTRDPISYLCFDPSGNLLFTADKMGHYFQLFRIFPHPSGSNMASVHHLYTLYRGETTAKIQNVAFSHDTRWISVTTNRGTSHIFPITPYGGKISVRTHTSHKVVNRLSQFHRSAGFDDTKTFTDKQSPVMSSSPKRRQPQESIFFCAFPNPCLPPYPNSLIINPLLQLKQSTLYLGKTSILVPSCSTLNSKHSIEDIAVRVSVAFASPRGCFSKNFASPRERLQKRAIDSLFIVTSVGILTEYILEPQLTEKIAEDAPIRLIAEPCFQWDLSHPIFTSDLQPPLPPNNYLVTLYKDVPEKNEDSTINKNRYWLSQVEIISHLGPHRHLWMGPQFSFKTYAHSNQNDGAFETENHHSLKRSNPMNMPQIMRYFIGVTYDSCSSKPSPRVIEIHHRFEQLSNDKSEENNICRSLAEAMSDENPTIQLIKEEQDNDTSLSNNNSSPSCDSFGQESSLEHGLVFYSDPL